jgi:hypothetical protein
MLSVYSRHYPFPALLTTSIILIQNWTEQLQGK